MPVYEYLCPAGHRAQRVRKIARRRQPVVCAECGEAMDLTMSRPHVPPDGVYSYAPNIGSADAFERRQEAIRTGQRVIPKIQDKAP